jgi:hypothetical protein
MANWQYTLNIKEIWQKGIENKVTSVELAKVVVEKLKELRPKLLSRFGENSFVCSEQDALIVDFEEHIEEGVDDDDCFNDIFSRLYDWADINLTPEVWPPQKLCWVKTDF